MYSKNNFVNLFVLFITTLMFYNYAFAQGNDLLMIEKINVSVLPEYDVYLKTFRTNHIMRT